MKHVLAACLVTLAGALPAPALAAGGFVRFVVPAPTLGGPRGVTVLLPESYVVSERRYPVVYFQDGQNVFNPLAPSYSRWNAVAALQGLSEGGREVIAVAIDNGERLSEYTPHADPNAGLPSARAGEYIAWMTGALKPFIDARLRTLSGREDTAIVGSSLGGLVSLAALVAAPDVFGLVGALSPSLWVAGRASLNDLKTLPPAQAAGSRVYLSAGTLEPESVAADAADAAGILEALGARVRNVTWPQGAHNEATWAEELPGALAFLFLP